ncbi:hypothetical protein V1477_006669 [Vespula maculifrons]|uniref:Uncharacterized protein n=1 Tax=Vespula maculifrons TaxID=7453 RepID=A0ABD2CJI5_VESMC
MSWARVCGLLCGFPPFSIEKSSSIFVLWFWSNTTGRVSRYLKLTVWTVAFFVSKVSFVSSFLIGRYLPKRKDISNANFRVESPLARGSPNAATSSWWDLVTMLVELSTSTRKLRNFRGCHPCKN